MIRKAGIIAAFPAELAPMVSAWRRETLPRGDVAWRGRMGSGSDPIECIAVAAGMGRKSALRACDIAASRLAGLDILISVGLAGGLVHELQPGVAYPVAQVIDSGTGVNFFARPFSEPGFTLVTIDHVAAREEKHGLQARHQASLADMEAATVAEYSNNKHIIFCCAKSISDVIDEPITDFARFVNRDGKLRKIQLAAYLARRPRTWPAMARLGKNSRVGAIALAEAVREFFNHANDDQRVDWFENRGRRPNRGSFQRDPSYDAGSRLPRD